MKETTAARRLARAERRNELLEEIVESQRRERVQLAHDLSTAQADLESAQELMPTALVIVDMIGRIVRVNQQTANIVGCSREALDDTHIDALWPGFVAPGHNVLEQREANWRTSRGEVPMLVSLRCVGFRTVCVGLDLRARRRDEEERRRDQKLQSLGQLSAGIAHELNTPMQFINDNVTLLERGFGGMLPLLQRLTEVHAAAIVGDVPTALLDGVLDAQRDSRWTYYAARVERAFARTKDGIERITRIVGAMKVFSHPGNALAPVDINHALENTLVVATPELKHVAHVTTQLAPLPPVLGYPDDLNQVFLNLLVNAAHAITDAGRESMGKISLRTHATETHAVIDIGDTGCGIPTEIRERVYDPFFTTKAQGRGTGQGLALAHAVIVDRHGGTIDFETSPAGTTFHIRLPLAPQEQRP